VKVPVYLADGSSGLLVCSDQYDPGVRMKEQYPKKLASTVT
jgi:hypothetical protein